MPQWNCERERESIHFPSGIFVDIPDRMPSTMNRIANSFHTITSAIRHLAHFPFAKVQNDDGISCISHVTNAFPDHCHRSVQVEAVCAGSQAHCTWRCRQCHLIHFVHLNLNCCRTSPSEETTTATARMMTALWLWHTSAIWRHISSTKSFSAIRDNSPFTMMHVRTYSGVHGLPAMMRWCNRRYIVLLEIVTNYTMN